jgi:hypothetical protein
MPSSAARRGRSLSTDSIITTYLDLKNVGKEFIIYIWLMSHFQITETSWMLLPGQESERGVSDFMLLRNHVRCAPPWSNLERRDSISSAIESIRSSSVLQFRGTVGSQRFGLSAKYLQNWSSGDRHDPRQWYVLRLKFHSCLSLSRLSDVS